VRLARKTALGVALLIAAVAGLASYTVPVGAVDFAGSTPENPLAVRPMYVDPNGPARQALGAEPAQASAIEVLASTPQARWFTETTSTAEIAGAVSEYVGGAAADGSMPIVVVYAIPFRDCGGFTHGGFGSGQEYGDWIGQVRAGIGGRPATVIVEPDALTALDCVPEPDRATRYAMLKDATQQLTADASTTVYIDGGHSRWLGAADLANRLRQVGVDSARGFSLNVSNFFTVEEEIAYGEAVSALVGGKRYVVDTSRNGLGPAPDGPLNWCNPPGRALGPAPTTQTAGPHADAYLWIKNPGQSDGECGRGDVASGVWFEQYAVDLVRRSR
jgi:endoglucanase